MTKPRPNSEVPKLLMPEPPRRSRWWIPLLGVLALLLAGLLWCHGEAEAQERPIQASACDGAPRPQGIGYVPPAGAQSCLFVGLNGGGARSCQPLGVDAHCFGELGKPYDYPGCLRRYGPYFHATEETKARYLATDFETLTGRASVVLQKRCCENFWGTAKTLSCFPTLHELHDWYAVSLEVITGPGEGGVPGTGGQPGVPRIETLGSPAPGLVNVRWVTRKHDAFEVKVGSVTASVPGDQFSATVQLPPGEGGSVTVTVAAFLGGKGRASLPRTLIVAPREAGPEPPPEPPVEPPAPPDEPEPPKPADPCPLCDTECPGKLASATQRAERAEEAQSQAEAALAALVAELAAVKADLKRQQDLPPIAVPSRVWETLQLQQEMGRVQGAGMRQRAREVRVWICTQVAPAAPECRS